MRYEVLDSQRSEFQLVKYLCKQPFQFIIVHLRQILLELRQQVHNDFHHFLLLRVVVLDHHLEWSLGLIVLDKLGDELSDLFLSEL